MGKKIQLISNELYDIVLKKSKQSPRKRSNHNFHELNEVYQRFLNVLNRGTYVQPHKHERPPKPETFLTLRGKLGFIIFNENGNIEEKYILSENGPIYGIDIQPGVWHSILVLSDSCICFEGKSGPYDPLEDKIFAPWAPSENSEGVTEYLNSLEKVFASDYF